MVTRTLYIGKKSYISTKNAQVVIRTDDGEQTMPIEDLGIVELDSPQITI